MSQFPKLRSILLIDDNEADNFLHTLVIKEAEVCDEVFAVDSGQKALDFLKHAVDGEHPCPDLIFLDINMPGMNGWEFIEEYDKLPEEQKGVMMVVMLTTSMNPDDEEKAKAIGCIDDFRHKPLRAEDLMVAVEHYFENHPSN